MKVLRSIATAVAVAALAASTVSAQEAQKGDGAKETPKVYHAGGRHDQKLREAAVRARANGQKMEQTAVHAGGRHDVQAHEAAMRAEAKRAAGDQAR